LTACFFPLWMACPQCPLLYHLFLSLINVFVTVSDSHVDGVVCGWNDMSTSDCGSGELGTTDGFTSKGMCSSESARMQNVRVCVRLVFLWLLFACGHSRGLWLLYRMRAIAHHRSVRNNLFTPSLCSYPSPCSCARLGHPVLVPVPALVSVIPSFFTSPSSPLSLCCSRSPIPLIRSPAVLVYPPVALVHSTPLAGVLGGFPNQLGVSTAPPLHHMSDPSPAPLTLAPPIP
jgi:hypothetical protein